MRRPIVTLGNGTLKRSFRVIESSIHPHTSQMSDYSRPFVLNAGSRMIKVGFSEEKPLPVFATAPFFFSFFFFRVNESVKMGATFSVSTKTSEGQEYKDALDAVKRGDESAKTKLAWYMLSGYGGADVDAKGAVVLLEERVKGKDAEAMWMLGVCNEFGIGIEQDIEQASKLYDQSKDGGNAVGENLAPWVHEKGRGCLKISCL